VETLSILEKKVVFLIDSIKQLKNENVRLVDENAELVARLAKAEGATKLMEEFDQERALTKLVVDDLIKNIDSIIECEKQL